MWTTHDTEYMQFALAPRYVNIYMVFGYLVQVQSKD